MKKSIYLLGMAVAALSSCSQSDVVEMPENRAIGFSTFVNNNTRAGEVTNANFSKFVVYGAYNNTDKWVPVYTNVTVNSSDHTNWTPEKLAYWEIGKPYSFCAYSNGNEVLTSGVTFDAATSKLSFAYTTDGTNDLVAASNSTITPSTGEEKVNLTFKHMLSKVKFTFKTDASDDYTMTVTALKIENAVTAANGSFTNGAVGDWTGGTANGIYNYPVTSLADFAATGTHSAELYIIPQSNETLMATVTVKATDGGVMNATKTFTVPVKYTPAASDGKGTADKWTEGYAYNYIATINPDDVKDQYKEIKFTTNVEDWKETNDQTPTPTSVPQP